jgi:lysozyme
MTSFVRGIDVSHYQPKVDWPKVKAAGVAFAVAKASQANWAAQLFATHWAGAKGAGLLRGAYHFLTPDVDPLQQAAAYLKALGADPGDLPPVLDIEAKTDNPVKLAQYAQAWLAEVEKQLKRKPVIYTAAWYWNSGMLIGGKYPAWAADYGLWVAAYPVKDGTPTLQELAQGKYKALLPKSWTAWTFWQYSEKGRVDGVANTDGSPANVDLNVYNGSLEDLGKLLGLDAARLTDLPSVTIEAAVSFAAPMMAEEPSYGEAESVTESARLAEAMEAGASAKPARKPPTSKKKAAKPTKKPSKKKAKSVKKKPAKKSAAKAKKRSTPSRKRK